MARSHRSRNPERYRNHELKRYNITVSEYDEMLIAQQGRCTICRRLPGKVRLSVDHNHKTGEVRKLLCAPCNRHVGWFEKYGAAVVSYLSEHG